MTTRGLPGPVFATLLIPHRQPQRELRATGLRLNNVDERRRVTPTKRRGLDTEFLHCPLVQRRAIEASLARHGLQIAQLSLGRRLIRSYGCHRRRFLTIRTRSRTLSCRHFDWSVDDPANGGAELEVRAELGAEPERGKCSANRLGFRFFEVVPEVSGR